jgi:hypothetical protein
MISGLLLKIFSAEAAAGVHAFGDRLNNVFGSNRKTIADLKKESLQ